MMILRLCIPTYMAQQTSDFPSAHMRKQDYHVISILQVLPEHQPSCYQRVQVRKIQAQTMLLTRADFHHTRWSSCRLFILAGQSFELYHPSGQ